MLKTDWFACPCCAKNDMDNKFLSMLDNAMVIAGFPFAINSGYRCKKHNLEVGGSATSSHLKGVAADIGILNNWYRFKILSSLIYVGFERINPKIKQCLFKEIGINNNFLYQGYKWKKIGDETAIAYGYAASDHISNNQWVIIDGLFLHVDNDVDKPREILWID